MRFLTDPFFFFKNGKQRKMNVLDFHSSPDLSVRVPSGVIAAGLLQMEMTREEDDSPRPAEVRHVCWLVRAGGETAL